MAKKKRLVYSTDGGRLCPDCNNPVDNCACSDNTLGPSDGIVRLHRQSKGRAGKPVTLITGLGLTGKELKTLAKALKSKCGTGGSVEGSDILIQGDKRDLLKTLLEAQGHTVKIAGG